MGKKWGRCWYNLQSNPRAAYLFKEDGKAYKGKRLYLTKVREETDENMISAIRRHKDRKPKSKEYLVYFQIDKVLPLIGAGEEKM